MNDALISKPGLGRRLTDLERIGILTDLDKGTSYDDIQASYQISRSTISVIRHKALEDNSTLELIKKGRTNRLYQVSEWVLDAIGPEEVSGASLEVKNRLLGTLEDKIAQREGRTGNVNIAFGTFQAWGFGKKPVEDDDK
ncbi:hypothetical protein LCGC14_2091070 [marine sediment metagenome]|uniref:Uncharacterized protein n=1 Tax=marine sediment metagenome TaxID=412755 RepID=A0A0F9ED02_9ZZZZ